MPWKERCVMDERMFFIGRLQNGEKMTDLCKEFGISRKTGYKFLNRYNGLGPMGFYDLSRRPHTSPHKTSEEIKELIFNTKQEKPTWGAAKIREWLIRRHNGVNIPSRFTVHEILNKYNLVQRRISRRKGNGFFQSPVVDSRGPNEIWCADFKGQFQLGNGKYCYPLTVSDHFSRFLITCEGLENTKEDMAQKVFENTFEEYGLPDVIKTDNGVPFASIGLFGLSKLSVWWLRLGIKLQRIEPGQPQQNGRHERMHLTLKRDTTRPSGANFLQQQEKFDQFKNLYNTERPHEALGMKCPGEIYQHSKRKLPKELKDPQYPFHDYIKRVDWGGKLRIRSTVVCVLSKPLSHQVVGLREEDSGLWRITFMDLDLGLYDEEEKKFKPFALPQPSGGI